MVKAFSLPKLMEEEIDMLVKSGYYSSKSDVVKDALRIMIRSRPELRIAVAVELFKEGKVSIGKAAEIAGMTVIEFKDALKDRRIKRVIKAEKTKEMDKAIAKIKRKYG